MQNKWRRNLTKILSKFEINGFKNTRSVGTMRNLGDQTSAVDFGMGEKGNIDYTNSPVVYRT